MVTAHPEPVTQSQARPRFIYITGCDGTGKTTQARLLLEQLRSQDIKARQVWLRFPFLFSLPLLVYARWRGYSWQEKRDGAYHGYWDFRGARLLRWLLPWTLLIDAALVSLFKIYLTLWRGETVVCERFVLDMLVDLAVACNDPNLHRRLPGRLFLSLLPAGAKVSMLDLDAATIRQRRADLVNDQKLEARLKAFRLLAKDYCLPVFSSQYTAQEINLQIKKEIG